MKKSAYRNKNCLKHLLTWEKLPTFAKHKGNGGLAQLARALAWHARGHRFDSDILHSVPVLWGVRSLTCWNRRDKRVDS